MDKIPGYLIPFTKYKWEFLRRNPKYIEEWEKLKQISEIKYGKEHDGLGFSSLDRNIPEENLFCNNWGLYYALNPHESYGQIAADYESYGQDPHATIFPFLFMLFLPGQPIEVIDGFSKNGLGFITIKIDIRHSQKKLLEFFKLFINTWKGRYKSDFLRRFVEEFKEDDENSDTYKLFYSRFSKTEDEFEQLSEEEQIREVVQVFANIYEEELEKRQKRTKRKYHFENFDLYLQVYDLKKEGKSWAKITSDLNLNSIQTARNHYNSARKFIKEGIEL